ADDRVKRVPGRYLRFSNCLKPYIAQMQRFCTLRTLRHHGFCPVNGKHVIAQFRQVNRDDTGSTSKIQNLGRKRRCSADFSHKKLTPISKTILVLILLRENIRAKTKEIRRIMLVHVLSSRETA